MPIWWTKVEGKTLQTAHRAEKADLQVTGISTGTCLLKLKKHVRYIWCVYSVKLINDFFGICADVCQIKY